MTLSMVSIVILGLKAFIAARNVLGYVEGVLLVAHELDGFVQTVECSKACVTTFASALF